jgi:hypothetical protein
MISWLGLAFPLLLLFGWFGLVFHAWRIVIRDEQTPPMGPGGLR